MRIKVAHPQLWLGKDTGSPSPPFLLQQVLINWRWDFVLRTCPGNIIWECDLGMWSVNVIWECDLGMWSGNVAWECDPGMWPGNVIQECGLGMWSGNVALLISRSAGYQLTSGTSLNSRGLDIPSRETTDWVNVKSSSTGGDPIETGGTGTPCQTELKLILTFVCSNWIAGETKCILTQGISVPVQLHP